MRTPGKTLGRTARPGGAGECLKLNPINAKYRRSKLAHTSLELLAAILVMLILTAIAMAGFRLYDQRAPVDHSATRLAHMFSTARAMAISHNTSYGVRVSTEKRNFWIDEIIPSGYPLVSQVVPPEQFADGTIVHDFLYGLNQAPLEPIWLVRFFADGSSDDVSIILALDTFEPTRDEDFTTVRVYGPTGQTRVFENERRLPGVQTKPI